MDKVNKTSMAIKDERLKQLQSLFPEAFSEGKVDFDKLRQTLGEHVDSRPERYSFTWAGKREAMQAAQIPSRATLVPDFAESVNFDETDNIFIEGDNLEVLKLLARPYFRRVKMIYIDPPYNTGNDFVYPDNYADPLNAYLRLTGQKNGNGDLLTTNTDTNGRYHSGWLSMMYPRLLLARQMLRDDGVIFVSIDDNEVHNLRLMLNEIFGESNFVANIVWQKKYTRSNDAKWFSNNHDHILIYARNKELFRPNLQPRSEDQLEAYSNPDNHPKGRWKSTPLHAKSGSNNVNFNYTFKNGVIWTPPKGTFPRYSMETLRQLDENDEIWFGNDGIATPSRKSFLEEVKDGVTPVTIWLHSEAGNTHQANNDLKELDLAGIFDNPKPVKLLNMILELTTESHEHHIIMDFFAGSGTTAQAVMELNREDGGNRRFILIQLPEKTGREDFPTISAISRERIRRVMQKMQSEENGKLDGSEQNSSKDLGFRAFRLAETNYRPDPNPEGLSDEEYNKQMALWAESLLVDNWDAMNVIYEVALKEGYGLNIRVEEVSVDDNTVYRVTDPDREQSFGVCLDETLRPDIIDAIGLKKDDLFICHDNALDDTLAANLALQARLQTL